VRFDAYWPRKQEIFMPNSRLISRIVALTSIAAFAVAAQAPSMGATDAKAGAILAPVLAAHKRIKTMSCTVTVREQQGTREELQTVTFAYRKPDFAKVVVSGKHGPVLRCTSNGKKVLIYSVEDKKYLSRTIPAGNTGSLVVAKASQSMILKAYMDPQQLLKMLNDPAAGAHFGGTANVGGVPVDLIGAGVDAGPDRSLKVSCGFSHRDHLLRSIAMTMTVTRGGVMREMRLDETVTSLSLSPRLASNDFSVVAPRSASAITAADMDPGTHDARIKPGATPFPINAKDIAGKPVSLGQYRGKVLLIDFWATWCGPCVAELPNVQAVYNQYHKQGLEVVGFSQDEDESTLKSFVAQRGMPWRQVFCGSAFGGKVTEAYGVHAIPFMVLIGRDGKIAAVDMRGPELGEAVASAIAKR
jgi:peroxiredoxin